MNFSENKKGWKEARRRRNLRLVDVRRLLDDEYSMGALSRLETHGEGSDRLRRRLSQLYAPQNAESRKPGQKRTLHKLVLRVQVLCREADALKADLEAIEQDDTQMDLDL